MPRPRKYDYKKDYPVTLFVKVPVVLMNQIQDIGIKEDKLNEEIVTFISQLVEKNRKID